MIKLAHYSIKEYLMSDDLLTRGVTSLFHFTAELSHSLIAQTCLGIITGNPGVFQGYPDPYPAEPVPVERGTGYYG